MVNGVGSTNSNALNNVGSSIINSITGGSIDIQSLAEDLTNAEKASRQTILDNRKQAADAKLSSIGKISSAANDFNSALSQLGDPKTIGLLPQSSNINVADFSFKPFSTPKPVDLSFVVRQLATVNTVTLPMINSNQALIGTEGADKGTLLIKNNSGAVIDTIEFSGSQKLSDLTNLINTRSSSLKTGLSATILNKTSNLDGTFDQILSISNGFGEKNNFSVELSYSNNNTPFTNISTGLKINDVSSLNESAGQDAIIANGIYDPIADQFQNEFKSSTNTFSNLISNINIQVYETTPLNSPVTISTTDNINGLVGALQTIVSGFNSLFSIVNNEIKYDADISKRGGLANDSIAKTFITQLRALTTKAFPNGSGKTFTLADIGVKTNTANGTLSIDMNIVNQIQQNRPEMFAAVLASKPAKKNNGDNWEGATGAIEQMIQLNKIVVGTGSDFANLEDKTKNNDEVNIAKDQEKLNNEMSALKARYLSQFTAMQNILNATKSDQKSLTDMMSSWSAGLKN